MWFVRLREEDDGEIQLVCESNVGDELQKSPTLIYLCIVLRPFIGRHVAYSVVTWAGLGPHLI